MLFVCVILFVLGYLRLVLNARLGVRDSMPSDLWKTAKGGGGQNGTFEGSHFVSKNILTQAVNAQAFKAVALLASIYSAGVGCVA